MKKLKLRYEKTKTIYLTNKNNFIYFRLIFHTPTPCNNISSIEFWKKRYRFKNDKLFYYNDEAVKTVEGWDKNEF